MDYEVFGDKSFNDVINRIRAWTHRKFWGEHERLEDAVSVAQLALIEYWIPKYGTQHDASRRYTYAIRYGRYRVQDHLFNEHEILESSVSLDSSGFVPTKTGGFKVVPYLYPSAANSEPLSLHEVCADDRPTPEDIVCSEAVVESVRRLIDELDWNACMTEETTRQEAKRTCRSQSFVTRHRRQAKACLRAAYRRATEN